MNRKKYTLLAFFVLILSGCGGCSSEKNDTSYLDVSTNDVPVDTERDTKSTYSNYGDFIEVPFTEQNGNTITIPVKVNGMGLDMIYDTGASTTTITVAEAKYLYEKGKLTDDDFVGKERFQSADGSIHEGLLIIIRELDIGNKIHLTNIEASVIENQQAPLLLGQTVLKKFREVSVDRVNMVVKFYE